MRYLSVCSGIEAATVAWHPLGWEAAAFSEIEAFPRAVLAHHYPDVPCHGDFTTIGADDYGSIDLLVGGTPCQSFSVAGLRGGLDDDRGNLALEYLRLADRKRPRWLVWENVPGVLSSNGGRDFGAILGGMVELGYGIAYRVLDAQFFGVPQRRRRVFVIGYTGDWRRAAAVLFERHGLQGHSAPRRQAGQRVADSLTVGANQCSGFPGDFTEASTGDVSHCLNAGGMGRQDYESETLITHTLTSNGDAHSGFRDEKGLVPVQDFYGTTSGFDGFPPPDVSPPLKVGSDGTSGNPPAVAFGGETVRALTARHDSSPCVDRGMDVVAVASAVRRLTPRECERLQGFPDDYTAVPYRNKPASDGPRYKALGNSMAVPCMRWIGERIEAVEAIAEQTEAA